MWEGRGKLMRMGMAAKDGRRLRHAYFRTGSIGGGSGAGATGPVRGV